MNGKKLPARAKRHFVSDLPSQNETLPEGWLTRLVTAIHGLLFGLRYPVIILSSFLNTAIGVMCCQDNAATTIAGPPE